MRPPIATVETALSPILDRIRHPEDGNRVTRRRQRHAKQRSAPRDIARREPRSKKATWVRTLMSSGKRRRARARIAALERKNCVGDLIGNERRRQRRLQSRKPT